MTFVLLFSQATHFPNSVFSGKKKKLFNTFVLFQQQAESWRNQEEPSQL